MIKPSLSISLFLSIISFFGCEYARVFEASKTGYYCTVSPTSIVSDSAVTVSLVENVSDQDNSRLYIDVSSKSDAKITISSLHPIVSLINKNGEISYPLYHGFKDIVSLNKRGEKYTYVFMYDSLIPKDIKKMNIDFNIQYSKGGIVQQSKGSIQLKRHIYRDYIPFSLPHGC